MFGIASAFAPSSTRIYLYAQSVDMRKSFNGLWGIVQAEFARDIRDGDLFLFLNRRGDRIKAMYWDRDGIAIWMKRSDASVTSLASLINRSHASRRQGDVWGAKESDIFGDSSAI